MKSTYPYLIGFAVVCYLTMNTGIVSDDFSNIARQRAPGPIEWNALNTGFGSAPLDYYAFVLSYRFSSFDNHTAITLLKIFYTCLSLYLISRFFSLFLSRQSAILCSFYFLFLPSHDATTYFFLALYLPVSFAFYLYSYYLIHNDKLYLGVLFAFLASFISYGSPPIAVALFILFALKKEYAKGLILIAPNVIYSAYYIVATEVMRVGAPRVLEAVSLYSVLRLFTLQVLTFVDALFGPSMWLKIYYSFYQLSGLSWILGFALVIMFLRKREPHSERCDYHLVLSLLALMFVSFAILTATGRYPQIAFGLGNRITIFGSLLVAYLIVVIPGSRRLGSVAFALLMFSILGISDHWKTWNGHQQEVISRITENEAIGRFREAQPIFVSGNQYSRYGPISHIEFLSEDYVPGPLFQAIPGTDISALTLNRRHEYADGFLFDTKYGTKRTVGDHITVYDSEGDELLTLNAQEINPYIDSLLVDSRHWTMLSDNPALAFIRNTVLYLMPRVEYAFN